MYSFKLLLSLLVSAVSFYDESLTVSSFIIDNKVKHHQKKSTIRHRFERNISGTRLEMGKNEFEKEDDNDEEEFGPQSINVLGTPLVCCCDNVGNTGIGTGFYRNGYCSTGADDLGRHTVCVKVSSDFLQYSKEKGNDLSTPVPDFMFPGLKHGDIWCLCAQRWVQAYNDGMAPELFLQSTHEKTLSYVPIEKLKMYALDRTEADKILNNLNEQREKLKNILED